MEELASKTLTVIITTVSGTFSFWSNAFSLMSHSNLKARLHELHFTGEGVWGTKVTWLVNRRIKI